MTERDKAQPDAAASAGVSRREFVTRTAAAGAGLVVVPRHVLGRGFQAPSDTVNIAIVGVSGMGFSNTSAVLSQNITAFCDVDFALVDARIEREKKQLAAAAAAGSQQTAPRPGARPRREPSAAQLAANDKRPRINGAETMSRFLDQQVAKVPRYRDYREMLEKQKDIDAVIIATPDHMHAAIATAAMDLGKHVYVQKPLCWSVEEARHLARKAKENPKIVTQMVIKATRATRRGLATSTITSGAIGEVREVHVWTNRPLVTGPGRAASGAAARASAGPSDGGIAVARSGRRREARRGSRRQLPALRSARLGFVPRRRAAGRVSPDLSAVQLARLGRLGAGCPRRHGRAPDRPSVLVVEARVHNRDRDRSTPSTARGMRLATTTSTVPGPRRHAGHESDVV